MKLIFVEDLQKNEISRRLFSKDLNDISVSMRNLLIFFGRSHEEKIKKLLTMKSLRRKIIITSHEDDFLKKMKKTIEDLREIFYRKDLREIF